MRLDDGECNAARRRGPVEREIALVQETDPVLKLGLSAAEELTPEMTDSRGLLQLGFEFKNTGLGDLRAGANQG